MSLELILLRLISSVTFFLCLHGVFVLCVSVFWSLLRRTLVILDCGPPIWPYLNIFFLFNWRVIPLNCCVGFCCRTAQISHKYTDMPSLLRLSPTLPNSAPLQVIRECQAGTPASSSFPPTSYFIHGGVYTSVLVFQFAPPSPDPIVPTRPSSMAVSLFLPYQ